MLCLGVVGVGGGAGYCRGCSLQIYRIKIHILCIGSASSF